MVQSNSGNYNDNKCGVKVRKTDTLKSLHLFMSSKYRKMAVSINSGFPQKSTVDVKTGPEESSRYEYELRF